MYNLSTDSNDVFRVPDLRGEFLRGAGTNSHINQGNGGTVGEHQDGTAGPAFYNNATGTFTIYGSTERTSVLPLNADSTYGGASNYQLNGGTSGYSTVKTLATSRPTNTSVNFIIKY